MVLFAQDDQPVRSHELFQQGRSLCKGDDLPNSLLGGLLLSSEQGLGCALLEYHTTPDGLLRLGKTPDGLQGIGRDIVGGRIVVIRQRAQVISLRLCLDRFMCPIG